MCVGSVGWFGSMLSQSVAMAVPSLVLASLVDGNGNSRERRSDSGLEPGRVTKICLSFQPVRLFVRVHRPGVLSADQRDAAVPGIR